MMKQLSPDQIKDILKKEDGPKSNQTGRIRFFNQPMICTSPRCGCRTYIQVDGIPLCQMHTIMKANEIMQELDAKIERLENPVYIIDEDEGGTHLYDIIT